MFHYHWQKSEANFGPPIATEVTGGTHIACECIIKFDHEYVALRRPEAIPGHEIPKKTALAGQSQLYFVHGLPRWGETMENYVKRIINDQTGVGVKSFRVVDLHMEVYETTQQWAVTPDIIVDLNQLPMPGNYGNEITEVVTFSADTIPDEFGWWTKDELSTFLATLDK